MKLQLEMDFDSVLLAPPSPRLEHIHQFCLQSPHFPAPRRPELRLRLPENYHFIQCPQRDEFQSPSRASELKRGECREKFTLWTESSIASHILSNFQEKGSYNHLNKSSPLKKVSIKITRTNDNHNASAPKETRSLENLQVTQED
ncbi:GATA type zinc finger transcription factor family protein [Striga asiatica]|uniref:GATA type zinc finger transcription factor family protein n=1 Tax=Striga asiatica TaxID=4170 RepID=A0A5A7QHK6_STRAF|nr:GATA type zinc finger transcription factor family protein [Striga asiatica]